MKYGFENTVEPAGRFIGNVEYQIHEPVIFTSQLTIDGVRFGTFVVEAGTVTDFASIPRVFWRVLPPWDRHTRVPAILHDDLYTRQLIPRKAADLIFQEALLAWGAPKWKAHAMYQAVNWFGWAAWRQHAREKAILDKIEP